jgi:hypothetical protein
MRRPARNPRGSGLEPTVGFLPYRRVQLPTPFFLPYNRGGFIEAVVLVGTPLMFRPLRELCSYRDAVRRRIPEVAGPFCGAPTLRACRPRPRPGLPIR